jgi:hypothetical protein
MKKIKNLIINLSVDLDGSQFKSQSEAVDARDYFSEDFAWEISKFTDNYDFIGSGCGMGSVDFQYHIEFIDSKTLFQTLTAFWALLTERKIINASISMNLDINIDDDNNNYKELESYREDLEDYRFTVKFPNVLNFNEIDNEIKEAFERADKKEKERFELDLFRKNNPLTMLFHGKFNEPNNDKLDRLVNILNDFRNKFKNTNLRDFGNSNKYKKYAHLENEVFFNIVGDYEPEEKILTKIKFLYSLFKKYNLNDVLLKFEIEYLDKTKNEITEIHYKI